MKKWVFLLVFGFLVLGCGDDPPTSDCPNGECCEDCLPEICTNGVRDAVETDVDCGGVCGATCEVGSHCTADEDCVQSTCRGARCVDPNTPEPQCREHDDCDSRVCERGVCQRATCADGIRNGNETGTDCGGGCPGCPLLSGCMVNSDCASGFCIQGGCRATPCGNGVVDLGEACDDGNLRDGDNCSADCQMVTCKVGSDLADLQEGIDSRCETILIGAGVFDGDVVIDRPVQIFGDGAEVTEIRGSGVGPVLTVTASGVHLGFLKIAQGQAERGAGILHGGGALTLQNVEVRDNVATVSGGGLYSGGGNVSIVESLFDSNQVLVPSGSGQVACGGAIATIGVGIDVESVEIRANRVVHSGSGMARGAGICLLDSRLGAEKLQFNLNQIELNSTEVGEVLAQGSGIYATNSELLIIGASSFSGNSIVGALPQAEVRVEGGLIHTEGGQHIFDTVRMENTEVDLESTTTTVEGGVIWTTGASWNAFNVAVDGVVLGRSDTLRGGVIFGDGTLDLNRFFVNDVGAEADTLAGVFVWFKAGAEESALGIFRSEFKDAVLTSTSASGIFVEGSTPGVSISVGLEESGIYEVVGSGDGAMIQAVSNDQATVLVDIINSTLAGDGAVAVDASGAGVSVIRLFNATLKGAVRSSGASAQFQPGNSIIDADPACVLDGAAMVSRGFNLMVGQGCNAVPSDLVGIPASLAPLAYNDSDTMTFSPQAFSLAINAGNPAGCSGPDGNQLVVDQRGKPRTDARCDIGAHEAP